MPDATTAQPVGTGSQLGLDIGSILSLITGLSGNSGANKIAQGADPWGPNRGQYMDQLNAFMKDPSSVLQDPAFKAAETVGAENVSRQAGAAGMANSGNRLADLFTFGQTAGLNFENQKFQQLQQLAGVNAGSPVAAAGLQMGALQNQGTNLSTGLAGVLPMIMQLLGLGGTAGGNGGIADIIKGIMGGGSTGGTPDLGTTFGAGDTSGGITGLGDFNAGDVSSGDQNIINDIFTSPPDVPDLGSIFGFG